MKAYLSPMLSQKKANIRALKAELASASGHTQAVLMNELLRQQAQVDHIHYLAANY